jgi:hypothetical protein
VPSPTSSAVTLRSRSSPVTNERRAGAPSVCTGHAFGDRGLPDAGLALDPHAGVGDQAGAEPAGGVQADGFGGVHVPADRDAVHVRAGGHGEGEQAADLAGRSGEPGAGLDVPGAAAAADRPAPPAGHRPPRVSVQCGHGVVSQVSDVVAAVVRAGRGQRPVRWASRSVGSMPTPSATANPVACAPRIRRSRNFACPARCSTSATAAGAGRVR